MESSSSRYLLVAIIAFFSLILSPTTISAARAVAKTSTNTDFIKTSCCVTTYPRFCSASLANQATIIRSDPKLLAHAALSVSLNTAKSTSAAMVKLSQSHGMRDCQINLLEVGAMRECIEQLRDSADQLRKSMAEMTQLSASNYYFMMHDIQTWVSAALTDEDTCMDGFSENGLNGKIKTAVREQILNVAHLTSNALALINSYTSLHG